MQKFIYSIEQDDDPYCEAYTDYVFLTKETAIKFAKTCPNVRRIAIWEYNESLQCYQKSYDDEMSILPKALKK